jgi:hypothetical protein
MRDRATAVRAGVLLAVGVLLAMSGQAADAGLASGSTQHSTGPATIQLTGGIVGVATDPAVAGQAESILLTDNGKQVLLDRPPPASGASRVTVDLAGPQVDLPAHGGGLGSTTARTAVRLLVLRFPARTRPGVIGDPR